MLRLAPMRRAFLAMLLVPLCAWARGPEGMLALVRTPNDGVPAIVAPGEAFDAVTTERVNLRLVGPDGVAVPLEIEWTPLPGARFQARCTVPAEAGEGAYAIEADEGRDRTERAVYVRTTFPESYAVVHVTDTHVGAAGGDTAFADILDGINRAVRENRGQAAFVLITGDLTDQGTPEQFRRFLELLGRCVLPTFVCPGNHDRAGTAYEDFFGPTEYAFTFGEDGYLVFDTKDFRIAADGGQAEGRVQVFRRQLKPSRWTVGATHRYDPDMGMRTQIALFIDDPLDHLLIGHEHRDRQGVVPWGTTPYTVTPAAKNGAWRVVLVTPGGVRPAPVGATGPEAPATAPEPG